MKQLLSIPQTSVTPPYLSLEPSTDDKKLQTYNQRIWITRPGSTPTSVIITPDLVVDDLKSIVLSRYPTSLAQTTDPSDLIIRLPIKTPQLSPTGTLSTESIGNDDSKLAKSFHFNKNYKLTTFEGSNAIKNKPLILKPDQIVWQVINYYSVGTTIDDALVIERLADYENPKLYTDLAYIPKYSNNVKQGIHFHPSLTNKSSNYLPLDDPSIKVDQEDIKGYTKQITTANEIKKTRMYSDTSPHDSFFPISNKNSPNSAQSSSGVLLLPRQLRTSSYSDKEHQLDDQIESTQPKGKSAIGIKANPNGATIVENHSSNSLSKTGQLTKENETQKDINQNLKSSKLECPKLIDQNNGMPTLQRNNTIEPIVPSLRVLIVEDNEINQKILEAFMRKKKIRYEVAKNGQEALDKWRYGGFHLILMDIQLPVMSGIAATKEIRRLEHNNRIGVFSGTSAGTLASKDALDTNFFRSPVIIVALTASSLDGDKSEALAAGCNDFLTKPVNLAWLEQKIMEWGCMQALIDFEGWKMWSGSSESKS